MAGNKGTTEHDQDNIVHIRARITGKLYERLTIHKIREKTSVDAVVSKALEATLPK